MRRPTHAPSQSAKSREKSGSGDLVRALRCTETRFARTHDGLGAIGCPQLAENAVDIIAHGFRRDRQPCRDLDIVEAARNQIEDFAFAIGELEECGLAVIRERPVIADELLYFSKKLSPRRLMLQQDVIAAVQRHEFRIGDCAGDQMTFGERHPTVVARVQNQRGAATSGNRSLTSMASNPRIRPTAFSGEVDSRWRSLNQRYCSGLLSGMNVVV